MTRRGLVAWAVGACAVSWASLALAQANAMGGKATAAADAGAIQQPQPSNLGGPGESCRARSDCKPGLRCMNQVCTDEHEGQACGATSDCGGQLECIAHKCTSSLEAARGGAAPVGQWMKFELDDGALHAFAGVTIAGGPTLPALGASGQFRTGNTQGAFLFALEGGLVFGANELSLELAPMTYFYLPNTPGPTFEANAAYHYLVKLYENDTVSVFYPIGIGAGLFAGNTGSNVFFQARLDLVGVMFKVGHVLVDVDLPSFRYGVTSSSIGAVTYDSDLFTWLFGASVAYAF